MNTLQDGKIEAPQGALALAGAPIVDRVVAVMNELPHRLFLKDKNSVYVACNAAYASDLGVAASDLVGMCDYDFFPRELADRYRADDMRVMRDKQIITVEEPYLHGDHELWLRTTKKPLFDADGEVSGVLGIFEDITEHHAGTEALRRRNWTLEALNRTQHALVEAADEQELLQKVCDAVTFGDEYMLCWIGWAEADKTVRIAVKAGTARGYAKGLKVTWDESALSHGPAGVSIREGRSVVHNRLQQDPTFAPWRDRAAAFGIRSVLSAPLKSGNKVLGAMLVYSRREEGFGPEEVRLFEDFASTLMFGVESVRMRLAYEAAIRTQLEQEERMSRTLEAIMTGASVGLVTADAHGIIQFMNPAAETMFGYGRSELHGKSIISLMPPVEEGAHADYLAGFRATGMLNRLIQRPRELIGMRKNGEEFPIELAVSCIELNGAKLLIGSINDVTERKAAERSAREAEQLLRQISGAIDEVFWVADARNPRIVYVSSAFERVFGLDPSIMKDDFYALQSLVHEDDRERVKANVAASFANGKPYSNEYRMRRRDGGIRWIWGRGFPVNDETGTASMFIGIAQDITERKEAEAKFVQAQKLETLGHLAGGIAHDFNNLLMAVQMGAQFAKESGDFGHLDMIIEAADRGADLVRRLSAFSRQQELQSRPCDPRRLLRQSLKLVRTALPESIAVETDIDVSVAMANLDPALMESALLNLAINARDAMPEGGTLVISARNVTRRGASGTGTEADWVEVSVTDSGTGMDAQTLEHAFEPFFTTKEIGKGTGLGLSMVHGFVNQSGGFVEIESKLDEGTQIRMYFPAIEADAQAGADPQTRRSGPPRLGNVLLVDDDASVRRAITSVLRPHCENLIVATNGPEALELIAPLQKLDLAISDIVMPSGMTGYQLADLLAIRHPECRILLMSGYHAESRKDPAGRFRVLQKPFSPQTLFEELEKGARRD